MIKKLFGRVKNIITTLSVTSLALSTFADTGIQAASCSELLSGSYTIGQQGSNIVELQDCLTSTGHFKYAGGSTGYYGGITQAALNAYKNSQNTTVSASCSDLLARSWIIGQQNNSVVALQDCLTTTGHFTYAGGSTGYYGSITQSALNAYNASQVSTTTSTPTTTTPSQSTCDILTSWSYYIGQQSTDVKDLQDCLTTTGHFNYSGGSTGYYGSITQSALNTYKASQGSASPNPVPSTPTASATCNDLLTRSWSIGQQNNNVVALQDCLTATGHFTYAGGSTGYYGGVTHSALNSYLASTTSTSSLDSIVSQWSSDWAGEYSVIIKTLDDSSVDYSYNNSKTYVTASTYKIFVAVMLLKEVQAGSISFSEDCGFGTMTVDDCLYDMIVYSGNNSAIAIAQKMGWANIQTAIESLGFTDTDLNGYNAAGAFIYDKTTTPNDVSDIMEQIQRGQLLNSTNTNKLINLFKLQIWRDGLPAGTPHVVADKVGFYNGYKHDTGTVYHPNGRYLITVMSRGGSDAAIANLSAKVNSYFND